MSLIATIPIYQGLQSKYYVVDGIKYHHRFPIVWALNHSTFHIHGTLFTTGPLNCMNCRTHGSIRDVFVGYCGNCIQRYNTNNNGNRGNMHLLGYSLDELQQFDLWYRCPYMGGIRPESIGDFQLPIPDTNPATNNETQEDTLWILNGDGEQDDNTDCESDSDDET